MNIIKIRKFLNDDFYNTAFNNLQKALIETRTVDNSSTSTGTTISNSYACGNTQDNMFLLSFIEVHNNDYGFTNDSARIAQGSEYAKCQGLYVYDNNSPWWLRSPDYQSGMYACRVTTRGNVLDSGVATDAVEKTSYGVRPACWINLP